MKISRFEDLECWQLARAIVNGVYCVCRGEDFKKDYSLTDQVKRAAVSIMANIAEGFSRTTKNEKIRFYNISFGSLLEIQNQIQIALDLEYINRDAFNNIEAQIITVQKLINGLIKSSKTK